MELISARALLGTVERTQRAKGDDAAAREIVKYLSEFRGVLERAAALEQIGAEDAVEQALARGIFGMLSAEHPQTVAAVLGLAINEWILPEIASKHGITAAEVVRQSLVGDLHSEMDVEALDDDRSARIAHQQEVARG